MIQTEVQAYFSCIVNGCVPLLFSNIYDPGALLSLDFHFGRSLFCLETVFRRSFFFIFLFPTGFDWSLSYEAAAFGWPAISTASSGCFLMAPPVAATVALWLTHAARFSSSVMHSLMLRRSVCCLSLCGWVLQRMACSVETEKPHQHTNWKVYIVVYPF